MADKKKIALCLEYPLALRGGVSVLVECLIEGLAGEYEFSVVSPDTPADVACSRVGGMIRQHWSWNPATPSPETSRLLAGQLAAGGVQLAHFHLGGNYGWGNRFPGHSPITHLKRSGARACTTVHNVVHLLDGYCGPKKPVWFKLAMLPLAWAGKMHSLSHVRAEVAVSRHNLNALRRWYPTMRGRFVQIYHSRLRETAQPSGSTERQPFILNVAHVAARKGQAVLADAFARIAPRYPALKLILAGHVTEESEAARIAATARKHGIQDRIVLLGEREDVMDWMGRALIYVQPSLIEALGLALQEALYCGCPCIATTAGGMPELIQHDTNGLLVRPGNADEMARALDALLRSPELRSKFSRAASATLAQRGMTFEKMIARHAGLYESILR